MVLASWIATPALTGPAASAVSELCDEHGQRPRSRPARHRAIASRRGRSTMTALAAAGACAMPAKCRFPSRADRRPHAARAPRALPGRVERLRRRRRRGLGIGAGRERDQAAERASRPRGPHQDQRRIQRMDAQRRRGRAARFLWHPVPRRAAPRHRWRVLFSFTIADGELRLRLMDGEQVNGAYHTELAYGSRVVAGIEFDQNGAARRSMPGSNGRGCRSRSRSN